MLNRAKILKLIKDEEATRSFCLPFFRQKNRFKWPAEIKALEGKLKLRSEEFLSPSENQEFCFLVNKFYYSQGEASSPMLNLLLIIDHNWRLPLQALYHSKSEVYTMENVNALLTCAEDDPLQFVTALIRLYELDENFFNATHTHIPTFDALKENLRTSTQAMLAFIQARPPIIELHNQLIRSSYSTTRPID